MGNYKSLRELPPINRSDPRPVYRQIADTLRSWIITLPPGTRLPTQAQIGGHFDVSPGCRDAAISILKREQLINSARGIGMFVAESGDDATPKMSLRDLAQQIADNAAQLAERLAAMEGS